jgi:hypothetical protein
MERDAWVACGLMVAGALVLAPGRLRLALGVLGGGLLMWVSFRAIQAGVSALGTPGADGAVRSGPGPVLVKFFTRHVILAFAAYVMMARLHLDPIGMLLGVSSFAVAAVVEAARTLRSAGPGNQGQ